MPLTNDKPQKTVIFAPLNWGLGHASRIVPLIKKYQKKGWKIILTSDGSAYQFLKIEFQELEVIEIDSKPLKYSRSSFLVFHLFHLLVPFLKNIKQDQLFVKELSDQVKIDLIISDNRYGFFHSQIKSIIITHQLQLPIPKFLKWTTSLVQKKLNTWISSFDECWVMDSENHGFAGNLSQSENLKIPIKYLGLQSRLSPEIKKQDIDFLLVSSGLEPQRSKLENLIIKVFQNTDQKLIIIGGQFEKNIDLEKIEYINFASTDELNTLLNRTKWVIARSGYSTIMDLIKLRKKALLIPTPGQTEQEYLAEFHSKNPNFRITEANFESLQNSISKIISDNNN